MDSLRKLVQSLGPKRLAIAGVVVIVTGALFAWVFNRASTPAHALLYGDLDMADASRMVTEIEAARVPYRLEAGGTAIYVPADQVARLRVGLAEKGLPSGGSAGYELFDHADAFGTTSFQQNVNLVRALEGELARSIRAIATVKAARVHLMMPKRELFSREQKQASASVLLQMRGNTRLTPGQVVAVQHLIASAVPDLPPNRISIIDGHGTLLSETIDGGGEVAVASAKADERRRQLETRLAHTIEQLLERIVGAGKVRAEVFADMDFDRINTSEEVFDPDRQVVRSTQTVSEENTNREKDSSEPVSVASNLPDANDAAGGSAQRHTSENRTEETINYEISKKVINHVREAGVIKRLSVAVVVDGTYGPAAGGTPGYQPRPQADLDQLTQLVRSAIGYDAGRGDTVEVVNLRFVDPEVEQAQDTAVLFGLEKSDLMQIGQYVLLLLFALLVLLFVVRPVLSRALTLGPAMAGAHAGTLIRPGAAGALAGSEQRPSLPGSAGGSGLDRSGAGLPAVMGGATHELIDVAGVEGKIQMSTLRQVGEIVERHPEETLSIIRTWLNAEE